MAERELKVKFTGDTSGLEKSLSRSEKAVKKTGDMVSKAGKAVAAGAAAGVAAGAAFAVKSVDTYKNVGGEILKLQRYTGATAEDASRMRAEFKLTGMDTEKAARSFGIFSKNLAAGKLDKLGVDLKDAHGKLLPFNDMIGKVADKISTMPPGVDRTALAMKFFGKSGADMLPFLSKGSEGLEKLAKKSDELGTTLSGKDLDALKDSKKQSRLLGLAWEGLQVTIGRKLLPRLTDFVTWVNEKGVPALEKIGKKIGDWLQPRLKALGEWWDKDGKKSWENFVKWVDEKLLPKLKDLGEGGIGRFFDMVKAVGRWAKDHPDWAGPIAAGIAAIALALKAFGIEFATTPLGLFILLISALGTAFYTAYTNNEDFRRSVDETVDKIQKKWGPVVESFQTDFLEPMKEKGQSFYNDFLMPLWHGVQWLVDVLSRAWAQLKLDMESLRSSFVTNGLSFWQDFVQPIWRGIQAVIGWFAMVGQSFYNDFALPLIRWFGMVGQSFWTDFAMPLWRGIQAVIGWFGMVGQSFYNNFALPLMRWFGRVGQSFWTDFAQPLWRGIQAVIGWFGMVGQSFYNNFALPLMRWFGRVGQSFWDDFAMPIWRGIQRVGGWFTGLWHTVQQVTGWIVAKFQWVQRQIDKIHMPSIHIPGTSIDIGGDTSAFVPPVPALAAGGIVRGTQRGTLVRAGEGGRSEAVVPLSRLFGGGGTANTYNINVDVQPGADPVKAGAAVVSAIRSYERVNGQRWRTQPS